MNVFTKIKNWMYRLPDGYWIEQNGVGQYRCAKEGWQSLYIYYTKYDACKHARKLARDLNFDKKAKDWKRVKKLSKTHRGK